MPHLEDIPGMTQEDIEKLQKMKSQAKEKIYDPKAQRHLVLIIVCIALLLDNMLYMVIVPVIPDYLRKIGAYDTHIIGGPENVTYEEPNHLKFRKKTLEELEPTFPPTPESGVDGDDLDVGPTTACNETCAETTSTTSNKKRTKIWERIKPMRIEYENEDISLGFLFASKAMVQLLINPFSGALIDRIGYDYPMMLGLTIMFLSTSLFAIGESYNVLFFARACQGVGSAFADTSGLAMIADRYNEEGQRTKALGIALACISFGCLVAPPFGGILYQFGGKEVPFIILAIVCLFDGFLMLLVTRPDRKAARIEQLQKPKGEPIWKLIADPHIAICAGALAMSNVSLAFIEPTIAVWMKDKLKADEWEIGLVWLPSFIPHVFGVYMTVRLAQKYPNYQWLMAAVGLCIEGICSLLIPFPRSFWGLVLPICGICYGIALIDTALLPTLGYIVDTRHTSVYGSVYAIADISYSLAYAFGPIVAGEITHRIGFFWLSVIIFITNLGFAPLLAFNRNIYKYRPFEGEDVTSPTTTTTTATTKGGYDPTYGAVVTQVHYTTTEEAIHATKVRKAKESGYDYASDKLGNGIPPPSNGFHGNGTPDNGAGFHAQGPSYQRHDGRVSDGQPQQPQRQPRQPPRPHGYQENAMNRRQRVPMNQESLNPGISSTGYNENGGPGSNPFAPHD
nr:vesicular acetylcholine transporter [Spadella cephaloptera]